MAKKEKREGGHKKLAGKNRYDWEALRRTQVYRQTYQTAFQAFQDRIFLELVQALKAKSWRDLTDPDYPESLTPMQLEEAFILSPEADELIEKFGMAYPWHPDNPVWTDNPDSILPVFSNPLPVKVIHHAKARLIPEPEPHVFPDSTEPVSISRLDISPHLREGRYLTLEIDLTATKDQIKAGVEQLIDRYRKHVIGGKQKQKDISYDDEVFPFLVWKMVHPKEGKGKTLYQITKELFPGSYNNGILDDSAKGKVDNALRKACRLIEEMDDLFK